MDKYNFFNTIDINHADNYIHKNIQNIAYPEIYTYVFQNIKYFIKSEFIMDKHYNVFIETSPFSDKFFSNDIFSSYFKDIFKLNSFSINEHSTFITIKQNYFHFYFDNIARLVLLTQIYKPDDILIFIDKELTSWQKEIIKIFNIPYSFNIIEKNNINNIAFKQFSFQQFPNYGAGLPHPLIIKKMNYDINNYIQKNHSNKTSHKRIYLSRQKAKYRKIINEDTLIKILSEKYYFNIIFPEDIHSVIQQYEIFNDADIIISLHGAALTNIIATKPNTVIIELFNDQYIIHSYYHLAGCLNQKYYSILCKQTNTNNQILKNDIYVDIPKIDTLLKKIIQ